MRWYHYLAYFFGGLFLANSLPHLGNGISGHAFQSPFASPPGQGLSSAMVNVLWGFFNLAVAYLLICRVGEFNLRKTQHVLILGAGIQDDTADDGHYTTGRAFSAVQYRAVYIPARWHALRRAQMPYAENIILPQTDEKE